MIYLSKITTWFRSILSWIIEAIHVFCESPSPGGGRITVSQTLWSVGGFRPKWCWKILLDQGPGFVYHIKWRQNGDFLEGSDWTKSTHSCWKWTSETYVKPLKTKKTTRGQIEKTESASKLLVLRFGMSCWLFHLSKIPCHHEGSQTSRPDRFRWLWKLLI